MPSPASLHHITSCPATATPPAAPAVSTVKVSTGAETDISFNLNQFADLLTFSASPQAAEAVGPQGAREIGAARVKVRAALWAEGINPPQQVEREEEQTHVLAAVVNQNTPPVAA